MVLDLASFIGSLNEKLSGRIEHVRYIPPRAPEYGNIQLNKNISSMLKGEKIESLYSHQACAINLVRAGEHTVIMTPTASGKTFIYFIPILEALLEEPRAKALYISPMKGLEQDQLATFNYMAGKLGLPPGAVYDGDTTAYRRKKIRDALPPVIFTNPDMLHHAINAFHPKWENFFRHLKFLVIDEIHAYRGIFGSNVAQVLRRLLRIAARWGAKPIVIACSATIANPGELAESLTGLPFKVLDKSGSPSGGKHFIFISNPDESPYSDAVRLFSECLHQGLRTIVFTKSRKMTELIYSWTIKKDPQFENRISPYRAGFLPRERREIEEALFNGKLLGVVSTSALELGVDIGGLDVCILVGYPGSISSTWQRAGRVGRHGGESLIALIGLNDALDQYLMRHPDEFFGKPIESVVIDENNENILKNHLPCAAHEVWLSPEDPVYPFEQIRPLINELTENAALKSGKKENTWYSGLRMPQMGFSIRGIGEPFSIVAGNTRIGETGGLRLYKEAFPGAIYLHRGRQYLMEEIDFEDRKVFCREVEADYFTKALTHEEAEIIKEEKGEIVHPLYSLRKGGIRLTYKVIGYEKRDFMSGKRYSIHNLDMPDYVFETKAVWLVLSPELRKELERIELGGSLHAFEHAAISAMPLFALCDKMDVGGISYPLYPPLSQSAIFFYDGHEGGIGLTWKPFDMPGKWFRTALEIIKECGCKEGCPSCIQDPQCGNGNRPLNKEGAAFLAGRLLEKYENRS